MLLQLFPVVWIFLGSLGVICYNRYILSGGYKNYFKDWCLLNSQSTFLFWPIFKFWIVAILSKGCKPGNFESQNSPKLSIANICGFCLNFSECESFLEWNSPDILVLYETNLDDSIDSGKCLPLILSDSITHIHDLAVYVKEELPLARDVSLENCEFLLIFLTGFTALTVLLIFPL